MQSPANLRQAQGPLDEHEAHVRLSKSGELVRDNEAQSNKGLWKVNAIRVQGKPTFLPEVTCRPVKSTRDETDENPAQIHLCYSR